MYPRRILTSTSGISHVSCLIELPTLHFPDSFAIDLMHLIPLNIMKNLWKLWNCEKLDVDKNPQIRESYVLSNNVTGDSGFIDRVLQSARRDVPLALGSVAKRYAEFKSFKAADWQDFIEVYGISLMYENLADDAFKNLVKLHEVWYHASK